MTLRPNYFLSSSLLLIVTIASSCQTIRSQPIHGIPLEAFEGFKQDTFTLPGESISQPVYKYGIYESKVIVHLDGVGKVYVHHVLYFSEDEYSYMEIYSRKPSSIFIQGIKRYGTFRMYEHQNYTSNSMYSGKPRIEIVNGLNNIVKIIQPLQIFNITSGEELQITGQMNDPNHVSFNVSDCKKYVDPILYKSLFKDNIETECGFSGWIQYDLESNLVKIDLYFGMGDDFVLGTFESVIYDSIGTQIGHIAGFGPLSFLNLTANKQYVYTNTGGAVTEDYVAPYIFRIFDLKSDKIIFSKRSTSNELSGFAIPHSNLGVYVVKNWLGGEYSEIESYVIDHDKGVMYIIHQNSLCQPPNHTTFYPTYCECYMSNGMKSKLYYERDFTTVKFEPKL